MRDHDHRSIRAQIFYRRLKQSIRLRGDRTGWLIENENRSVDEHGAGNCKSPSLTSRQRHASYAKYRIIAFRQSFDERGGVRRAGRGLYLRSRSTRLAERDVLGNAYGEQKRFLRHPCYLASQVAQAEILHIGVVQQDSAAPGI